MVLLLQYTLTFASVLILVALGGCFSEHSGVINLGLEGVMIMGALGGALAMRYMPTGSSAFAMLIVVLLAAALAGTVYSSLLAVACINFKADQTIVGTALNMLGTAGRDGHRQGHQHRGQPRRRVLHHPVRRREKGVSGEHRLVRVQLVHAGDAAAADRSLCGAV